MFFIAFVVVVIDIILITAKSTLVLLLFVADMCFFPPFAAFNTQPATHVDLQTSIRACHSAYYRQLNACNSGVDLLLVDMEVGIRIIVCILL